MQARDTQPVSARQLAKAKLLNNLGYSLNLSGDWEFALRHFHRALDINADFECAWLNIGLV
jgi:tetratricopeptide (TPR) repeat protein